MAFVTPVMEHWLEREIAQWVHHEGSHPSHHERTLLPRSYMSLPLNSKMAAKTQHLQYLTRVLWVRYCVANQAGTKINPRWPLSSIFF